jgi:hypothetical protein
LVRACPSGERGLAAVKAPRENVRLSLERRVDWMLGARRTADASPLRQEFVVFDLDAVS